MRSLIKFGAPVLAAALVLTGCGTKGGTTASGGGTACDLKIGFFGALTGDAANLGINIKNGADLAVKQYNEKHANCKVTLTTFDSQGDPAQAPALAQKAVSDKKVIGIVGPAFSGESKAADPIFAKAGLTTITPSATNPTLSQQGWPTFFRMLGNDASQAPAAAKYIKDVLKAKKVFVADDSSEYGKGLADIVRKDLASMVVGNDSVQQKQTDFSATVTKVTASNADAMFYGGYYAEAAIMVKQLRQQGWKGTFVAGDGVKDDGFIKAAGAAAEGAILTCPCLPPEKAPEFQTAFKAAYGSDPATYSAEGYDSANVFLAAIAAGKTTPADVLSFVKSYSGQGVTKQIKFDAHGEPSAVTVWAYKVSGGKIVPVEQIQ
ncbi:branched-chain amino acid ABC transporter substrate-binding protein [Oryzihumus sp.]|uniref:branched-chain amino acid ABC transporter substrate-binding protein n=1 Tax=Oryzihumus sp. TaxID=1968903 RepID=UPI002EDA926C